MSIFAPADEVWSAKRLESGDAALDSELRVYLVPDYVPFDALVSRAQIQPELGTLSDCESLDLEFVDFDTVLLRDPLGGELELKRADFVDVPTSGLAVYPINAELPLSAKCGRTRWRLGTKRGSSCTFACCLGGCCGKCDDGIYLVTVRRCGRFSGSRRWRSTATHEHLL